MKRSDFKFAREDKPWQLVAVKLNAFGEKTDKYRIVDDADMQACGYVKVEHYDRLLESYRQLQGSYIRSNY